MKRAAKFFLIYWVPVFLWAALIFFLSGRPGLKVAEGVYDFLTRKPAHILEYLILTILLVRAFLSGWPKIFASLKEAQVWILSVAIAVLYGALDEFHQLFVPQREGKISDVFFDSFGALFGIIILWRLFQTQKKKLEK